MSTIFEYSHQLSCMSFILLRKERDTLSFPSRSTGSSDSVNVILDRQRERLVHHELHFGDIKSSRGDICANSSVFLSER